MAEYIEREAALESVREKLLITDALPAGIPKDASTFTLASMQHSLEAIPAADVVPASDFRDCRNELCLKCGAYTQKHNGACDGCRWRKADV